MAVGATSAEDHDHLGIALEFQLGPGMFVECYNQFSYPQGVTMYL